jgi:hypothetical protein
MILFNISYVGKDGIRTLFGAAQGRCMCKTREEAEQKLRDIITTNGEDRVVEIYGEQSRGTFRVDPFECWDHGDPKGIYVTEEEP